MIRGNDDRRKDPQNRDDDEHLNQSEPCHLPPATCHLISHLPTI
jgi:hypothetical protein